ncbi:MAG: cytidine deaminase [Candidatus Lustribacter sp.]|jgi:homotetrameric cytidine deaminase
MRDLTELRAAARAARERAYAPYSHFTVGAAVETSDGRRFTGANVENASYGLTICAERTAVFAAVLAGGGRIAAVAVSGPDRATTPPCGACRQVLAEFGAPDAVLSYARADGTWTDTTLGELLPDAFDPAALEPARGIA